MAAIPTDMRGLGRRSWVSLAGVGERSIFGQVRYMLGASPGGKFDSKKYIQQMGFCAARGAPLPRTRCYLAPKVLVLSETWIRVAPYATTERLWRRAGNGRLRTSTRKIDLPKSSAAEHAERWPQSNTNDHSSNADESFLIPLWNFPSFFSRSSVDSSDASLQHQG
jgi:hypothetical protein